MKSIPFGKRRDFFSNVSIDDGPYNGGIERLIVWNSKYAELTTYKMPYFEYTNSGVFNTPNVENATFKYGIYKQNPEFGVITNELVNSANFDDFVRLEQTNLNIEDLKLILDLGHS